MMLYKPNIYDADYRQAENAAKNAFNLGWPYEILIAERAVVQQFRGIEIDVLFDTYAALSMGRDSEAYSVFVEIVEKLVEADALNAAQVERFHRIVTAEK